MLMTTACDRKTIFHQYNHTAATGWERSDTMFYNVGKINGSGAFKEEIDLRLNGTYPFLGLCIIVEHTIYPANITTFDTLNCSFDRPDIKYKSNGISYRQYRYHLKDINLTESDSVTIRLRHNMMREVLPGIADIGVKLTKQ